MKVETLAQPVPSLAHPVPIDEFGNTLLRDAVMKALEGVEEGHGWASLDVVNKGAGLMVAHRFEDLGRLRWGLVLSGRFDFEDGGEVRATLAGQW